MSARHRIISLALVTAIAATAIGCTNKKEVEFAKRSLYDADFAIVFSAALAATRDAYPNMDDTPGKGIVRTAWHPVPLATVDDPTTRSNQIGSPNPGGTGQGANQGGVNSPTGLPTRIARNRQYIRFDVSVLGGRPWRVRVVGHASEWEVGNALPTPLTGAARPPWLDGRIDSLRVAIYKKLQKHAVKMPDELPPENPDDKLPKMNPAGFVGMAPAAATMLAGLKDSLSRRDYTRVRGLLADDVVWSLGAEPGADTAMVMWQADAESLDRMSALIEAPAEASDAGPAKVGCGGTATKVTCPAGAVPLGAWQLVFELRGTWKVTSFVRSE